MFNNVDLNNKLPLWAIVPSVLLLLVYVMLSYLAFADQGFWYESMGIPVPEHAFLLWSWGGKNSAMVVGLLLAMLSRRGLPILIMMGVFLTGQFGDINAGARTGVNVFVTYIGMAFVALQVVAMVVWANRSQPAPIPQAS